MSIRIVTHCYAAELPQYAVFLRAQLSSLYQHPTGVPVRVAVCYTPDDAETVYVLNSFKDSLGDRLIFSPVSPERLFRRAIGRNAHAKFSREDLIWFADVDYYFGPGCLDSLWETWQALPKEKPSLVWPREVLIQRDHATGDKFWKLNRYWRGHIHPDFTEFAPETCTRAIGGVQIVNGDYARKHGYLDGHSQFQQSREKMDNFRDDVAFRKEMAARGGEIRGISIPNLYRLRHSATSYRPIAVESP